jgi:hypothetical protein
MRAVMAEFTEEERDELLRELMEPCPDKKPQLVEEDFVDGQ